MYEAGPIGVTPSTYTVSITTSDEENSGTDNKVFIDIIGTKGRTQRRKLDNKGQDDFERGKTDKFKEEWEMLFLDFLSFTLFFPILKCSISYSSLSLSQLIWAK